MAHAMLADMNVPAHQALWPVNQIERWPIDRLVPYARNARTHTPAQVDQIAASIREWGWTVPILVDENGTILAGHARVLAANKLGITEIPVIVARGWTEAQKRGYALADNKLTLNAGWNEELLRIELADLKLEEFLIELLGFDDAELNNILDRRSVGLTDPDDVPPLPINPVARRGDLWFLGRHRLLCGDATERPDVQRLLAGAQPHLMVTDPPYGVNYNPNWRNQAAINGATAGRKRGVIGGRAIGKVNNDDRADWRDAWALFGGDVVYCWHGALHVAEVQEGLEAAGFVPRSQIIWAKNNIVISRGDYHFQHEPCWYAVRKGKTGHWQGSRTETSLWAIAKPQKSESGHSTQKPVECMRRPIENNSSAGQAVYDPFVGSGTTIIAAEMTGRRCYAIEINPAYVDVCIQRWQDFTEEQATLDGKTFAEVRNIRLAGLGQEEPNAVLDLAGG
jgi:DNA modification methylase